MISQKIKVILKNHYLLFAIIAFGSILRIYNLNWDRGHVFHPDEMNIDIAVSQIRFFSQLNPHFFQYNGLPIYLYRITGEILKFLTKNSAWVEVFGHINLIGRFFSALFSSVTIYLVYKLSHIFSGSKKASLLSAFFVSSLPALVQSAHFAVTESLLVFFLMIVAINSINFLKKPSLKNLFFVSISCGFAIAVKTTALSFFIFPAVVFLITFFKNKKLSYLKHTIIRGLIFLIITFITFFIISPYNILDWQGYRGGMLSEKSIITGTGWVPWNQQFIKTKPFLFQFYNLFWQMGPLLPILSLLSFVYYTYYCFIKRKYNYLPPIIWSWVYLFTVGTLFVKFVRYFNPLLPFFCILCSFFIFKILKTNRLLGKMILLASITTSLIYSLAFLSIYTHEQTRFAASKWIFNNIDQGSVIITENDDHFSLPIYLQNQPAKSYEFIRFNHPYKNDDAEKIDSYIQGLSKADFLIIANRRLYHTIGRLPEEYPFTSYYYKQLFKGALGYQKIAEFDSYPQIFGFKIKDYLAEETSGVFDHPKVMIFKNVDKKNKTDLNLILTSNLP